MKAPDGSYGENLAVPGSEDLPQTAEEARQNLDRNNPLSLHDDVSTPWACSDLYSNSNLPST